MENQIFSENFAQVDEKPSINSKWRVRNCCNINADKELRQAVDKLTVDLHVLTLPPLSFLYLVRVHFSLSTHQLINYLIYSNVHHPFEEFTIFPIFHWHLPVIELP
jgi:hypothetical protein